MSHPVRGAWIEIMSTVDGTVSTKSHPVRGAWIEIFFTWLMDEGYLSRIP